MDDIKKRIASLETKFDRLFSGEPDEERQDLTEEEACLVLRDQDGNMITVLIVGTVTYGFDEYIIVTEVKGSAVVGNLSVMRVIHGASGEKNFTPITDTGTANAVLAIFKGEYDDMYNFDDD